MAIGIGSCGCVVTLHGVEEAMDVAFHECLEDLEAASCDAAGAVGRFHWGDVGLSLDSVSLSLWADLKELPSILQHSSMAALVNAIKRSYFQHSKKVETARIAPARAAKSLLAMAVTRS